MEKMTEAQRTEDFDASCPPYAIPVDEEVKIYHLHSPFSSSQISKHNTQKTVVPLGDSTGNRFVSYETNLGRSPAMANCPSCQQQVLTNVTYRIGVFAWLLCLVFILCGLVVGCCLIPFFVKSFKDVYHSCPRCQLILHVEKKSCC